MESNVEGMLAFWIVFVAMVLAVVWLAYPRVEGFSVPITGMDDYAKVQRDQYEQLGKQRYNRLADTLDVFRPGMTQNLTDAGVVGLNQQVKQSLVSNMVMPKHDGMTNTTLQSGYVNDQFPFKNNVLKEAEKCEAKTGRDACAILSDPDYAKCGVCIVGGTDTKQTKPETYIGGMLVLDAERQMAKTMGTPLVPTTGTCPAGALFVDKAQCEKAVKRQDCKEMGQTGGFVNGRTVEGKDVSSTCAFCPKNPNGLYVYEPKTRSFPLAVRIVAPAGTGTNTVVVKRSDGTEIARTTLLGGEERLLQLSGQLKEGQEVSFEVTQQFPHRPRGQPEVFHISPYLFASVEEAEAACATMGVTLATREQLNEAFTKGAQTCSWGFVKNEPNKIFFPMQVGEMIPEKKGWCGTGVGIQEWALTEPGRKYGAWCYGVKPPAGRYGTLSVRPFFESLGADAVPSQADQPNQRSQYGDEYVAPNYRAIILQWEMPSTTQPTPRRVPIESSIVRVMGQSPDTITSDGYRTFKLLRRLGTFVYSTRNTSAMIMSPNPNTVASQILPNQYWMWSNQKDNSRFDFVAQVPGVFLNPFFAEDAALCTSGQLIAEKETLNLLKLSPCLKEGQTPGAYNVDCLKFLFQGAGGNVFAGKGSPLNLTDLDVLRKGKAPFMDANKDLTHDEILSGLLGLYEVATKGRRDGVIVSPNDPAKRRDMINAAAQFLFGMDLVNPCETVSESSAGDVVIHAKSAPFDAQCLSYLYLNAGTDKSKGNEGIRDTGIKATYESIGDRFSGLRMNEKDTEEAKRKHPFQACQLTGSAAPINQRGEVNAAAVAAANAAAAAKTGSLADAQSYFNGIFKDANISVDAAGADAMLAKRQEEAIQKCYGIRKVVDPKKPSGCGLMARYIRVIRSLSGEAARIYTPPSSGLRTFGAQIRLSQVEVFNVLNEEIAKGKPVDALRAQAGTNAANANQGKPWVRGTEIYADSDTNTDAAQWWIVDLGDVHEVRRVIVYLTDPFNFKMLDSVVQLLDGDGTILAHKVIGTDMILPPNNNVATLAFGTEDVTQPIQMGEIKPGTVVHLQSGVMNNMALSGVDNNYGTFRPVFVTLDGNNGKRRDMELTVRESVAGLSGTISITFRDRYYLFAHPLNNTNGHKGCYYMEMNPTTDGIYKKAASWIVKPAISKEPGWFSLQNVQYPNMYLTVYPQEGVWGVVTVSPRQETDLAYQMLSCWRALPASRALP